MKIAVFSGSFDPITKGHMNIIHRASQMFDKLIVVLAVNSSKKTIFSADERTDFIKRCIKASDINNVEVLVCEGLLAEFAVNNGACAIIRGVRTLSDYEYELGLAGVNRKLADNVNTVFLPVDEGYTYISSSFAKEIASYGGDISEYVSSEIISDVLKKLCVN